MLSAVVQTLPIAIGLLLAAMPVLVIPVMLLTRRDAKALSSLFLAGWMAGFLLVGGGSILLVDLVALHEGGLPAWVGGLRIPLGLALLCLALVQWRKRPRPGEVVSPPAWVGMIDTLTPIRAAGLGFVVVALNPKNLVLVMSGALSIATATSQPLAQLGGLLVFMAIGSAGVIAPLLARWLMGERADLPLQRFKAWMIRNNATIIALVLLILGLVVTVKGIARL